MSQRWIASIIYKLIYMISDDDIYDKISDDDIYDMITDKCLDIFIIY